MLRHAFRPRCELSYRFLAISQARYASKASFHDPSAVNTLERASGTSYTAPLAKTVRNIKFFSLSSLGISTLISPVFFIIESDLDMAVRAAMVGVAILTSGVSTAVVAYVLKPYVVAARVKGGSANTGWKQGTRVPEGLETEALPMTMDQQDAMVTGAAPPSSAPATEVPESGRASLSTMQDQDIMTTSGIRQDPPASKTIEMTRLTLLGRRTTSTIDVANLVRDRNGRMFGNLKSKDGKDWFYVHETTGFWQTIKNGSRSVNEA
jgi:hypothetical protein